MGRAPEGRRMVMSAGLGSLSLVNVFLTTGAMAVIGVLLLWALVLLVGNKRSKPLRIVCVGVIVFAVIYFALIAALVFLFGSSSQPPIR